MKTLKKLLLGTTLTVASLSALAAETFSTIMVYKSPTCGCCTEWVKHLEENGFKVMSHNVQDVGKYKEKANLPYGMGSCHTAFVDGYAIEGHVPASDIRRMLTEKPAIRGIAVPGMPMGSPGMEYGDRKDAYKVVSFTKDGKTGVYSEY
ncbi:metal-binding protein [Endozoicomonas sp. (ex Bugula neritina AB1)]|nr:metal-binding protein [Endozoicomonas sp. (ex Bugula neritina AB1)]